MRDPGSVEGPSPVRGDLKSRRGLLRDATRNDQGHGIVREEIRKKGTVIGTIRHRVREETHLVALQNVIEGTIAVTVVEIAVTATMIVTKDHRRTGQEMMIEIVTTAEGMTIVARSGE